MRVAGLSNVKVYDSVDLFVEALFNPVCDGVVALTRPASPVDC